MSIRWDGNVALCCNDWRGYYKCGNILEQTLEEVWNSPAFDAARRRLYNGDRDFGACKGCDQTSYRVGLLPDAKGLDEMPYPNAESEAAMAEALSGEPYTAPVKREWEF
jgi:MoaA/NifB/PqqE/SkfB family radical SAM enzyme